MLCGLCLRFVPTSPLQELRAHFAPTLAPDTLPGLWGNLSHALGGLFCASLNFVARPEATAPLAVAMRPVPLQEQQPQQQQQGQEGAAAGVGWVPGPAEQQVLYASLPQEASCTENLTPWLKLLPCRCARGAGGLGGGQCLCWAGAVGA